MPGHLRLAPARDDAAAAKPIRVVLAEAHAAMRRSLKMLLDGEPRFEVVAETQDLAQTRDRLRLLHPDVLVLDLRLPDGASIESIAGLRKRAPGVKIVVLTMHESPLVAKRALDAGATAFVLKDTADTELCEAVFCAALGERYTSPRIAPGLALLKHARVAGRSG